MKLTLGFSPCPNDTFIFDALVNKRINTRGYEFKLHLADVEELNKLAFESVLDITKLSAAAYPKVAQQYVLLNSGGALGNNNGPLLISKKKVYPDEVDSLKIAIPGFNTTANLLLSIAYPKAINKKEYLFSNIEDVVLSGEADAGLIIHESRFTYEKKGLKKIVDLGEFWESKYNKLIPLGLITMNRKNPLHVIKEVNALIKESVEFAFKNPKASRDFVKQNAQAMDEKVMQQHISLYVNQYSLDAGIKGKEAISFLFEEGNKAGLIKLPVKEIFID
jgi:1,4-dihydroxy-6-naphthoate synthase